MHQILVVDDDKTIILFFSTLFQDKDIAIFGASNIDDGLEYLQKESIDVVVTDINLSGKNGLELLKQVKENYPDIPVILFTGRPSMETVTEALRQGAFDYIEKPVKNDKVIKIIDQAIRIRTLLQEKRRLKKENELYQEQLEKKVLDQTRDLENQLNKLKCLYGLSRLCENHDADIHHIIEKTMELIPQAFHEPGEVCARIMYDGKTHDSDRFVETQRSLNCEIIVDGKAVGFVQAFRNTDGLFTDDDLELIKAIGHNLEYIINSRIYQDNIQQTRQQLFQAEKMAAIGQIAAGVAHEINNPTGFIGSNLRTLRTYIEDMSGLICQYKELTSLIDPDSLTQKEMLINRVDAIRTLEKEMDLDFILEDIRGLIEESLDGIEKTKRIVHDLKVFSHPGENKMVLADINKNIDLTLNVVWNELKYKATVTKEYEDLPEIYCYPQQLSQVFANILINASHAIEDKGEIKIVTRKLNDYIEVAISDTGIGIPPDILPKIFDPFFTTKEVGKGTGLGMGVVFSIIEKHKGSIDVQSTVGQGTTFILSIPMIDQ